MAIKKVNGYSDGCSSRSVYCDGEIHVIDNWFACHHVLDYDDPSDPNESITIEACDPNEHHSLDTCYDCKDAAESQDEYHYNPCDIALNQEDESNGAPAWEYKWSSRLLEEIKAWREFGGPEVSYKITLSWRWAPSFVQTKRVGEDWPRYSWYCNKSCGWESKIDMDTSIDMAEDRLGRACPNCGANGGELERSRPII